MIELIDRIGPLGAPLAACSVLALALILDRTAALLKRGTVDGRIVDEAVRLAKTGDRDALRRTLLSARAPFGEGARLLLDAEPDRKDVREEAAAVWLEGVRHRLTARIGLLQLIAAVAPMLGLLGTVIGMVIAFREIAGHSGPVGPALLADGLWQAMLTTVAGLSVALPATIAASLFRAIAEGRVSRLAGALSRLSLALERRPQSVRRAEVAA